MKRLRWKRWLLWSVGCLLVLLVLGYIGMNMGVNYALKALTSSLDSKVVLPRESAAQPETGGTVTATPGGTKSNMSEAIGSSSSPSNPEPNSKESLVDQAGKDKPVAVSPIPTSTPTPSPSPITKDGKFTYQVEVSSDKAKAVEDAITLKEKAAGTSVLLKKLNASDIQLFLKMASNGMNIEEKKAVKKVIMEKLTEDEYNQLIQIAAKYGLSEGKSYKRLVESKYKYILK